MNKENKEKKEHYLFTLALLIISVGVSFALSIFIHYVLLGWG